MYVHRVRADWRRAANGQRFFGWHGQVLLPVWGEDRTRHGQEYLPMPPSRDCTREAFFRTVVCLVLAGKCYVGSIHLSGVRADASGRYAGNDDTHDVQSDGPGRRNAADRRGGCQIEGRRYGGRRIRSDRPIARTDRTHSLHVIDWVPDMLYQHLGQRRRPLDRSRSNDQ